MTCRKESIHRRTGTLGLGEWGAVTFLLEKNYSMPESVSLEIGMLKHSNCSKNKNVHEDSSIERLHAY